MKLLLGIGGTDDSWRALEATVNRVVDTGDDLTIAILDDPRGESDPEDIESTVNRTLDRAGIRAEIRRLTGDSASRLVELAETDAYDRIVIGGGERSPMGKIQIGPLVEFVVMNARTSVTLVR